MATGIFLNGAVLTKPDEEDFERLAVVAYEAYRAACGFDTPFQIQAANIQRAWREAAKRVWAEIAKRGGADERALTGGA